jgi:hypothetical protein
LVKTIVSLGKQFVSADNIRDISFTSAESLLDGDIILVGPDLSGYHSYEGKTFRGLECLDDDCSFRLKRDIAHWRSEIAAALGAGKTVIVWLLNVPKVSVATGEKQHSGTGRNRTTTRIVEEFDPYTVIPGNIGSIVRKGGVRIRRSQDLGMLATYWHEFGTPTKFEAYIDHFKGNALLETQTGNMAVAGVVKFGQLSGSLVLLPPPNLNEQIDGRIEMLVAKAAKSNKAVDKAAKARQTIAAQKKAEHSVVDQFITAIVSLDKAAQTDRQVTPPPTWTEDAKWRLSAEETLANALTANAESIAALQSKREMLKNDLGKVQQLRALLFEKGPALESAILLALRTLGFEAENFTEGDSEFDAVMVTPSGARLIGEAEGKDEKAINVDKLDQLDRNIKEDFARQPDESARFAHGVLFGNAYRLSPPTERGEFFTPKCMIAAGRSGIILVRTPDLFIAAKYLQEHDDEAFRLNCRGAITDGIGKVAEFPNLPAK